jgi:hypothetical protein
MNNYFLVKNFYNYEKVIPPPTNLPKKLKSVYVTDNDENTKMAAELGWDVVKNTDLFLKIEDKFDRRKSVAFINSFPIKVVPEINDANIVFICDSNIVRLWDLYNDFVNLCDEKFALFVTSGYYKGGRDNMISETNVACSMSRWSYGFGDIRTSANRYIDEIKNKNVDINSLSVVSAKYIGWNVKHIDYDKLSNTLYKEYSNNLHGNNILTYMSSIYENSVFNYYTNDYRGTILNKHNFEA